ncbi:MAG: TetR/AcrR family transcriptional regulator [Firmicutes bacterium]|nr:TetR/AcrR family transcriptional regulator [Bacillota bacterium]
MASREERRRDILFSAIKIFSQNGFHKSKIQEIAEDAGVGKGTIYEYFDSKKNLFQEMIKYVMELHIAEIQKSIFGKNGFREQIESFFRHKLKVLQEHGDVFQQVANQPEVMSEEMKRQMLGLKLEIFGLMESVVKEGIASGDLRQDLNLEVATASLLGTMNQYSVKKIYIEKLKYNEVDLEVVIDTLMKGFSI